MYKKYIMELAKFGGLQIKLQKLTILLFFLFFSVLNVQGQVTVSGAVTGNASYPTLGAAFSTIGTSQTGANIVITITGNTNETGIASLGTGDWASVTITPSGGTWTISGDLASELIRLDGADNVTINGLNAGGNGLTITNTNATNTVGVSTIKFMGDATNNTITNCTVLGSGWMNLAVQGGGVIFFSTGTTTGNDGNTISNCNIGPAGTNLPTKLIFSSGSTSSVAANNSGITITGCNLYDYFLSGGCAAISAAAGSTDWTITNNKIYQTGVRTFIAAGSMYGIHFSNSGSGDNVQITNNTIGYSDSLGGGTLTLTGTSPGAFSGVYLNVSTAATATCNVSNNTISNVSLTSSSGSIYGINNQSVLGSGSNTININGNTVRNLTGTSTTGEIHGIFAGSATTLNCTNNVVDTITRNTGGILYGIDCAAPVNVTFDSNVVNGLRSTATNSSSVFAGIFSNNSGTVSETFTNNTLTNFDSSTTSSQNMYAIYSSPNATGNKVFRSNIVNNFTLAPVGTGAIYGLRLNAGNVNEMTGNVINSFSGGTSIYAIYVAGGTTNNIFKNKVYGLSTAVTGASAVYGMNFTGGSTHNVYNNIIGNLTASVSNFTGGPPNQVVGINGTNGIISGLNLYNNTVMLNATSTSANFGSSAVSIGATPALTMRNNILVNTSAATGTGVSVVFRKASLTAYDASSNNNLFYGTAIYTDGLNTDASLDYFRIRLGNSRDGLSVNENPNFLSTTGSDVTYLHVNPTTPTQIESAGATIASVTEDFDGNTRNVSTPDIGADEFAGTPLTVVALNSIAITPTGNQCVAVSRTVTANVTAGGNAITSVVVKYSFNGIAQTPIVMTGGTVTAGTTSTFTAVIPAAVPGNANVTWNVFASDGITEKMLVGAAYKDQPFLGSTASATASSSLLCSSGSSVVLTAAVAPQNTAFTASFETGMTEFTSGSVSGTPTMTRITTLGSNGTACLRFYTTSANADVNASSAANVDLSTTPQAFLTFSHVAALEGSVAGTDFGYVQYSSDGGATWNSFPVGSYSGGGTLFNNAVCFSTRSYANWTSAITGSTTVPTNALWQNEVIAIPTSALTSQFKIRFRYTTNASTTYQGWYIDNVKIVSALPVNVADYSWSDGTTVVGTGNNLSVTPTATTTYIATLTSAGCVVSTTPVTVTIGVSQPTATAQTLCNGATVANLTATGTGIKWYADATGGSALLSADALSTNTYYVTQTISGCESPRLPVLVTVNTTAQPTASAQTFCTAATVADLMAAGTGIQWYAGAAGGSALATTAALSTGNYYVTQTISGCESPRLVVSVTVNVVGAPIGLSTQTISVASPSDATIEDLVANGSNIIWYPTSADALAGTNAIAAGTQLVSGTVYYATQTVGGCTSTSSLAVTATVTLGVKDFVLSNLKFYPNPVSDILLIENSETIINVEVFNIASQKVFSKSANSMTTTISMSEFAAGTYFVKVATEEAVKTVKVIRK